MSEEIREKLARAREAAAKRAAARSYGVDLRELEVHDLEAKFEAELGPRGVFFDIVRTNQGAIVVKLGPGILHKQFTNAKETTDVEVDQFVRPNVAHPNEAKYLELVERCPGIAWDCANSLGRLYHAKEVEEQGKA